MNITISQQINETTDRVRTEVKLRVLTNNNGIPVYGISIPRDIAFHFLTFNKLTVTLSGNGIILQPDITRHNM